MPLTGKEKLLRDILLLSTPDAVSKTELMHKLQLSSTHYDKLCTLVLKKAYRQIAGDNDLEQLNYLSKKFMFRHLFHDIRQLRSKVRGGDLPAGDMEKYYRAFFDFSINVPAKYFEEKFVMENAKGYLKYVTKDHAARELEVKAKLLFARLNLLTQGAPNEAAVQKLEREIIEIEKKYARVKAPEIKAILYHTWVNFYRLVHPDGKKRAHYLQLISKLYGGERNLPVFERAVAALHEAEMLYEKCEYKAAYAAYTQTFAHYMPMLRNQFHHFARWIELALILQKYEEASRLLDSLFKVYVLNHHESNGVLGSLLYAQHDLLTGNLDSAYQYISLAKSLNSIQVYFNYEIKLRMLEILYFAFSGDIEFVTRLAQRNMRYIQLQQLSLKKYKYAHFFFVVKDFTDLRRKYPAHLPPKIKIYLQEFEDGYDKLSGILLHKLLRGIYI